MEPKGVASKLRILDVAGWKQARKIAMIRKQARPISPAQRAFLEMLNSEFRQME